jgi:hypothetical protein
MADLVIRTPHDERLPDTCGLSGYNLLMGANIRYTETRPESLYPMAFWSDETFCVIVNEAKDITFGFATDPVYVFEKTIAETGILSTIDIRKDNLWRER